MATDFYNKLDHNIVLCDKLQFFYQIKSTNTVLKCLYWRKHYTIINDKCSNMELICSKQSIFSK